MARVQLALNVPNIDEAIDFYRKLFDTEPAKRRPGYANFAIADPPLKLVLIENTTQTPGILNHLGIEVETTDEVIAATARLAADDGPTAVEDQVTCCFAVQDKVWVEGPGGASWEIYTVLANADSMGGPSSPELSEAACCATQPVLAVAAPAAVCC